MVPHDPTSDTALLNEATAAATALDWKLQDPVNIPVLGLPDITHAESREEGPSAGRRAPATVPP
ncbi:MAG: hypothetical protein WCC45_09345 [Paeniglutamicibacter sp.]